jgi:hypothetical protein
MSAEVADSIPKNSLDISRLGMEGHFCRLQFVQKIGKDSEMSRYIDTFAFLPFPG